MYCQLALAALFLAREITQATNWRLAGADEYSLEMLVSYMRRLRRQRLRHSPPAALKYFLSLRLSSLK